MTRSHLRCKLMAKRFKAYRAFKKKLGRGKKGRNMNDSLKKAAAVSGALLATTAAELIATNELVSEAVDREEPAVMQQLKKPFAKALTDEAFSEAFHIASEELEKKELKMLTMIASDGTVLTGHWYPCDKPQRIILAFHGWRTTWSQAFGLYADFWHNNGCSVFFAEQRGQNNSGGECMGFGLTERFDCAQWAEFISCLYGESLPMYLWGTSMGATTVLLASELKLPDNMRGIIADCGYTSPKQIWKHVANKTLHIPFYLRSFVASEMFKKRVGVESADCSTVEALSHCTLPVFFVHGEEDGFVPIEITRENYEACPTPKKLLTVPGASHAMSYYAGKGEYEKQALEFWKDFDAGISESE